MKFDNFDGEACHAGHGRIAHLDRVAVEKRVTDVYRVVRNHEYHLLMSSPAIEQFECEIASQGNVDRNNSRTWVNQP